LNGLVEQSGIDHRIDGARDNLDPGLKQWIINGAAFAISFIPIAGS
jgi:hypothetical protein